MSAQLTGKLKRIASINTLRTAIASAVSALLASTIFGQSEPENLVPSYGDPARFEEEIKAFETQDEKNPPPKGAVLCIGSSSIRMWHETIHKDLAPLTLIPRGFGGSNMNDVLHFADRIVLNYEPRAILLYEGDNDIGAGIPIEQLMGKLVKFVDKVHAHLPNCRIYVLSIKPSIARWNVWPRAFEANLKLKEFCESHPYLNYIDIASNMLGEDGLPLPDMFGPDDLHMTRIGYESWRKDITSELVSREKAYE